MNTTRMPIRFVVGSRQVLSVSRQVQTCAFNLDDLLDGATRAWPEALEQSQGIRFASVPFKMLGEVRARYSSFLMTGLQTYARHYIAMSGKSYTDYLGKFSSKTRSGFKRKHRRLADAMGGNLRVAEFRSEADVDRFMADAVPLSQKTYQGRLLGVGLPEGSAAVSSMKALARRDEMRAYILYGNDQPLSYLYLPTTGGTIVYAYLGYDPEVGNLSVGTVLQLEVLERLFGEKRYRYFDFGEGTGQHKEMFATDAVDACSFFLLKRGFTNDALALALGGFNGFVRGSKWLAERSSILPRVRRILRR